MRPRVTTVAALILAASLVSAGAQTGGSTPPPIARARTDINLFLELHNHLMVAAAATADTLPEYRSEVEAYRKAREMARDPAIWRIVSDACVIGPDIKAIGKAAGSLPASLAGPDQEAAKRVIEALVSAWPRFEAKDLDSHRQSLQTITVKTLRKGFSQQIEERVMTAVYEKMQFKPLDAPVTIYPVLVAREAGVWGRTPQGYYLVIPTGHFPPLIVIENVVHELTHLLDANQPPDHRDFLVRLREKAAGVDPVTLDAFMHGLVTWSAGDMIKRFVNAQHKSYADLSPERRAKIERFLPVYEASWVGYVEGKVSADQAIDGLVAGVKAAATAKPAPEAKAGS